jgi:hypothetical protein
MPSMDPGLRQEDENGTSRLVSNSCIPKIF